MDVIFGKLITDDLKLVNHRAMRSGLQHQHRMVPTSPQPEQAVTIHITTSSDLPVEQAALYYTTDGSTPQGSRGVASQGESVPFQRIGTEWDSLLWSYVSHWQAVIPAQPEGTLVQYCISAWTEGGEEHYADWPNPEQRIRHATMRHFRNIADDTPFVPAAPRPEERIFNYAADTLKPPQWAEEAVFYHIFVDRFYPGDGQDWHSDDLSHYCGGTLWGVRDKLDYIAELGIDCIWLSPTWESPTYHGYDITDYERTAAHLGGDEALRAVVDGAHERGIRVLLDLATNHVADEHPIFQEALHDEGSPYRPWFDFDERYEHGYKSFFNVPTMPEINLAHPEARAWMIENGVRWIRDFDVDGFRLDVASGPGPNFWTHFRRACRAVKPDCLLFGEVIDTPDVLRHYVGHLDGLLDFPLCAELRRTYAWGTLDEAHFQSFAQHNERYYPTDFLRPSFLDNHDMDRFSFIAQNDTERLKRAVETLLRLPNPPILFYGTEVGLRQEHSGREKGLDVSRVRMVWDERQDAQLLAFVKAQIQARKQRRRR